MGFEPCVILNTGAKMPLIGYGTWQSVGDDLEKGLNVALEAGYRHIDTATVYENEQVIGKVLQEWFSSGKLKREDIFITTKLPDFGNRPESVEKQLNESLKRLQLDYVDLYLVHVPFAFTETREKDADGNLVLDINTNHITVWQKMEAQQNLGKAKAIGISNFNERQIRFIVAHCRIVPANLQVELHVYMQQKPLVEFCKDIGISVTSYSTLGSVGTFKSNILKTDIPPLMELDLVKKLAKKYNKTPAQILLRFVVQQNIVVIPKSTNPERIKENLAITDFNISEEDMNDLSKLDRGNAGRILKFKDYFKGVEKHPEFPFTFGDDPQ